MESVSLTGDGWTAHGVLRARSFRERWRGVKSIPEDAGLLLQTRSVHGFGMHTPLRVVAVTPRMRVYAVRRLLPRRVMFFLRARFVLELPLEADAPLIGSRLEIRSG